ncbi:ribonuclease H-like domain-containing protein [Tanacetum coccineum]|uniref:Ribonuclease H-like domain-containing protein n=1 Tax=Tanacetum coccineum TaxID=301880 RepID=A0ABQ5CP30_9ASTR
MITLKPLPKIDPKDKGKKMIDEEGESDTKSADITEAEKKFKQLANDEEVARKVQEDDEFWNAQQNWKIVSWKLHSSSGVHSIMTDEGLGIHMFIEDKYPLKKEVMSQLIELKLETKEDSTMALELIRFVKKQIAELEPEDSDGDEKDL